MSSERTRPGAGRHAKRSSGGPSGKPAGASSRSGSIGTDVVASVVVFLVALPLCIGVAAASGVSVSLGIISGIVGGLVVGFLPGSTFQVSGPAAGLAVLVLEFTTEHSVALLGPVVLISGLLQMGLGMLKMGRLFQSISLSVVQGMLAGIGLPLMLSQTYALVDSKQLGTATKNIAGLPDLAADVVGDPHKVAALVLGTMSVVLCFLWKKVPEPLGKVPAPLLAVMLGSIVAALPVFDINRVKVDDLTEAIDFVGPADLGHLLDPAVLMMIVTFTIIASAESLFSAAAVDRMHSGERTEYNKELFSQGVGNTICGFLGALPMTAVIVRSAVNVQAGAKTKVSRILHGAWLLGFGLLLPGLLGLIPVTVLAGILLHAGWKLFNPPAFVQMWKTDRGEGIVMLITTGAIVLANLLEGVLAGLAVAIVLTALRMSHMTIRKTTDGDSARLVIKGSATFLKMLKLIDALESVADKRRVVVDARAVMHLDLACKAQLEEWADARRKAGDEDVEVLLPGHRPEKSPGTTAPAATPAPAPSASDTTVTATAQNPAPPVPEQLQPETFRPYVPQAQQGYGVPHLAAQGYAHGHLPHGSPYARQHQHTQQHQQQYGMGGQVYGRAAYQQQSTQQSQVHLPHPAHSHQHFQQYPQYPQPQAYGPDGTPPQGIPVQGPGQPQGYGRPPGYDEQQYGLQQGYDPSVEGTWAAGDDWAVRRYDQGNPG
ncbi:SulP family inorganic anion transporter [Streptomyces sp. NPDC004609]|uniref:SulP family inorganic anion transporter n=1 Tax=Streptomyces sp. NPDC004609 TaxID=3364704 RepID=UPI0036CFDC32